MNKKLTVIGTGTPNCDITVSAKKNAHFFMLVAELCQFLGGS
jgi:hypothetical protein